MVTRSRAQSPLMGVVLIIGLSVVVAGVAVVAANGAIASMTRSVSIGSAESAMAELDRQASLVALGNADVRVVDLGRLRSGRVVVREEAGWLRLTHHDHDGTADEVILNRSLGAVVYRNGETAIAFQAGGLWRSTGSGSLVLAPPEVHYRDQTLTLGLIRIRGHAAASNDVQLIVRAIATDHPVYPNASASYGGGGKAYANPIETGNVTVTVHSAYAEAWADFFRERTSVPAVRFYPGNSTVVVELGTTGTAGSFQMPSSGGAVELRGLPDRHAIEDFEFTLFPDETDSANFANLLWSLSAASGSREFTITLAGQGKICQGGTIDVTVRYDGPDTTEQVWRRQNAFTENATAFSYECGGDTPTLHVNLTGCAHFEYDSGASPVAFDEHTDHGEPETFSHGERTSIDQLTNHYLALFDSSVSLFVRDHVGNGQGNGAGSVDEGRSFGTLDYTATDVVSYLHVTSNVIAQHLDAEELVFLTTSSTPIAGSSRIPRRRSRRSRRQPSGSTPTLASSARGPWYPRCEPVRRSWSRGAIVR